MPDDAPSGQPDTPPSGIGPDDRFRHRDPRADLPPADDESALSEGDDLAARLDVDPNGDDVKG